MNFLNYEVKRSKIIITPLINSKQLVKEGEDLVHCVGGYTIECLLGKSHILSLRNELGKSISTIELQIIKGRNHSNNELIINIKDENNYHLKVIQHLSENNATPSAACLFTAKLFFDDLRSGKIKIDLPMLEEARINREKTYEEPSKKTILYIGYDHKDKTPDKNGETPLEKATRIYREEGLDNGLKVKIHVKEKVKEEEKKKKEEEEKPKKYIAKQLTINFDNITGKKKEETKYHEESKSFEGTMLPKIDNEVFHAIKHHVLEICGPNQVPSKYNVRVDPSPKNDEVYIEISGNPKESSLNNLIDVFGDKAIQSINRDKKDKVITKFTIARANLTKVMEILNVKAQLSGKGNVAKAKAKKLENSEEQHKFH